MGEGDQLGRVRHPKLAHDVAAVRGHGAARDFQLLADLVIIEPHADEAEDRALPFAQDL